MILDFNYITYDIGVKPKQTTSGLSKREGMSDLLVLLKTFFLTDPPASDDPLATPKCKPQREIKNTTLTHYSALASGCRSSSMATPCPPAAQAATRPS